MKITSPIRYYGHVMVILFAVGLCLCSGAYADELTDEFNTEENSYQQIETYSDNVLPKELTTAIQINQNGREVAVSYRGGAGQTLLKSLEVQFTTADNIVTTQSLGTNIGERVVFTGTGCGDEVIVTAEYYSGLREVVASETLPVIQGVCGKTSQSYSAPCAGVLNTLESNMGLVDLVPKDKTIAIQIGTDIRSVVVSFRGGFGQNMVKSIQVLGYSADGTVQTGELDNIIGDSVRFTTDGCGIRIVVQVSYLDGTSYTIVDEAVMTYVRQ